MTSLKRTMFTTNAAELAAQTGALTAAWKKAFDGPIREAALKRAVPERRTRKTGPAQDRTRSEADSRT